MTEGMTRPRPMMGCCIYENLDQTRSIRQGYGLGSWRLMVDRCWARLSRMSRSVRIDIEYALDAAPMCGMKARQKCTMERRWRWTRHPNHGCGVNMPGVVPSGEAW